MKRSACFVLCVLCAVVPAAAGELAGVSMPDTSTVDGNALVLNGMGLREKMWIDVYVAGFYLEDKSQDAAAILAADQVKHLRMHFVYKKVGAKKLTAAWTDGLKANAGERMDALATGLTQLNSWMEDVSKGDELVFTSVPGNGLQVEVKGQLKGVIDDEEFSRAFWSIFIGDKPPTEKLKRGLLGQN